MLNVLCVLLSVAVVFLSYVVTDVNRRLRVLENVCRMAADSLGAPDHG